MKNHDEMNSILGAAAAMTALEFTLVRIFAYSANYFENKMVNIPLSIGNHVIEKIKKETHGIETSSSLTELFSMRPSDNEYADRIEQSDAGKIKKLVFKDHKTTRPAKLLGLLQSAYEGDPLKHGKELSNYFLLCGFHLLTPPWRTADNQQTKIICRDMTSKAITSLCLISILTENKLTPAEHSELKNHVKKLFVSKRLLDKQYIEQQSVRDQIAILQMIDQLLSTKTLINDPGMSALFSDLGLIILMNLIQKPFLNFFRWDKEEITNTDQLSERISAVLFIEFTCIAHFINRSKNIIQNPDERAMLLKDQIEKLIDFNDMMLARNRTREIDSILSKASIEASLHFFEKNHKILTPEDLHRVIRQMDVLENYTRPEGKYNRPLMRTINKLKNSKVFRNVSEAIDLFIFLAISYVFERTINYHTHSDTAWDDRNPLNIALAVLMVAALSIIMDVVLALWTKPDIKSAPLRFNRPDWLNDFEKKYNERLEKEAKKIREQNQPREPFSYSPSRDYDEDIAQLKPAIELENVELSLEFNKIKQKLEDEYKQTKNLFMKKIGSKHVIYETISSRFETDPLAFYNDKGKFDQEKLYGLIVHELDKMLSASKKSEPIHFDISKIIDLYAEHADDTMHTPPLPVMQQLLLVEKVGQLASERNIQREKSSSSALVSKPHYVQFAYADTTREVFYQDLQAVIDFGNKHAENEVCESTEALLLLKHDIINVCTRLYAIKKSVPAFYYAMIQVSPNKPDPVSVLRHGAVHHDLLISSQEKIEFYRAAATRLHKISQLVQPGSELKANDLVISALEKPESFPISFRDCGELYSRFESQALLWHDEPVLNTLSPELIEDGIETRLQFIGSDASKLSITMAIVELGEIFAQLRHHGSLDDISVPLKFVNKCIEIRNKVVHGDELGDAVERLLKSNYLNMK